MRWIAFVVLLAIPLAGSALAPVAPRPPAEAPIEATSFAPALRADLRIIPLPSELGIPAQAPDTPCVPILAAARQGAHVLLSWTPCAAADRYHVLAGPSEAELEPLVEVNHASHVDLPRAWHTAVYAVRAGDGPFSAPVAVPVG